MLWFLIVAGVYTAAAGSFAELHGKMASSSCPAGGGQLH
jgi:hypothetical protein